MIKLFLFFLLLISSSCSARLKTNSTDIPRNFSKSRPNNALDLYQQEYGNYASDNINNEVNKNKYPTIGSNQKDLKITDKINGQSYYCDSILKTENNNYGNFDGAYIAIGVTKVKTDFNINYNNFNLRDHKNSILDKKFNFSNSKNMASLAIGQGKSFYNNIFIGHEFVVNIGDYSITNKDTVINDDYNKSSYVYSNFSYYSGKLGYNLFNRILPYVKFSASLTDTKFIIYSEQGKKVIAPNSSVLFGYGAGLDIALVDHLRIVVDYTKFQATTGNFVISQDSSNFENIRLNSKFSFLRLSTIWRF